jgi:hypothetical protein
VAPAVLAASPSVLVGTVEQCADMLLARRADLGINQWQLDAGMSVPDLDVIAPIIERVAAS